MEKRKLATVVLIIGLVLLVAGASMLLLDYQKKDKADRQYESLQELATEESSGETKSIQDKETIAESSGAYVSPIQFDALKAINPDIVGWLKIEGTSIDYPIVQTDDNETYLNMDFEGKKNASGAIFLDYESEPDFSGRHNILYGHHMKNGSMFKDIIKYKEESFFKEHQDITIYTPQREFHLRPFTVLYTDADGERRRTKFDTEEDFDGYVEKMTKKGLFYQKPNEPIGTLWSFVTCSYELADARTILYAYEVSQVEK
ncbi:class B sortase [Lacrimispora algidixylanolytica]|uniref:SrtB family sortase n=1 Tax=Lacrimispora algidixylanolytica TaxID=94868 RepID=A0A419TBR2_9FIRM|nr:class B sortase [Lacrimispora algidixylanolytica]RKD34887.1 SrtB family sortase [Lacrimispora algidixylanolytica]